MVKKGNTNGLVKKENPNTLVSMTNEKYINDKITQANGNKQKLLDMFKD